MEGAGLKISYSDKNIDTDKNIDIFLLPHDNPEQKFSWGKSKLFWYHSFILCLNKSLLDYAMSKKFWLNGKQNRPWSACFFFNSLM